MKRSKVSSSAVGHGGGRIKFSKITACIACMAVAFALFAANTPRTFAENAKLAAFTFDDGPHSTYTPMLLDGLKARGVKATFFVLGSNIRNKGDIVYRIYEEGHQLASHAWSHTSLTSLSDAQIRNEIERTAETLADITGLTDFMVRPPNGAISPRVAAAIGAPVIMWNADPTGGVHPTAQATMTSRLISSMRDGSIVVMHDTSAGNVNSALAAIDALKAQGFEFVTVNELFRLKGVTPQNGSIYYSAAWTDPGGYDESMLDLHWAAESIAFVQEAWIMAKDGTGFRPNRPMTRAVAVDALWRMALACGAASVATDSDALGGSGAGSGFVAGFSDVPVGQWYSRSILWACENGIAGGYYNGLFGTNDYVSREQFYVMLDRCRVAFGGWAPEGQSAVAFCDDVRISSWARQSVMNIRNSGFTSSNDIEIFRPLDNITRAEASELIMWFMSSH